MSSFTANYNVYAVSTDGSTVQASSIVGQDVEVSNSSDTLAPHGSMTAMGFDGPFDGGYTFVSKVGGSGGSDGFIAKDSHGHSFFFTSDTLTAGSHTLNLESGTVPICFLEGTLIRTPRGERPVESLQVGEFVTTAGGGVAAIRWIGHQAVVRAFADSAQLPVCLRAGALGAHVPSRDLYLSPNHAVLVDEVLIQAGCLINGSSITKMQRVPARFTYFHIETEGHCLVLANNTPAETFIDNVDRAQFDNWDERGALPETETPMAEMEFPRVKAVRQVPRDLRHRLDQRGGDLYGAVLQAAA